MAYKKKDLFEAAKAAIVDKKLFFIEDVVTYLPCGKTKFYDAFKTDSNEMNILKDLLEKNKISLKVSMRNKWFKSNSPALQIALMKLLATPEERAMLTTNHQDITSKGEKIDSTPSSVRVDVIMPDFDD
ncbi:hypothetical protein [uncultured Chryseobacterium sp.]|uniref:hypothetical protein n=1 Tax=uncultured Chryseobacterium sp. TaxID=259322 RepID=UPI0025D51829|nr:hypothetical protein [uncultured Chryseobacterium sp.]